MGIVLEAPDPASAPKQLRLFANQKDLDMDDASSNEAATQEFEDVVWTPGTTLGPASVSVTVEVNFLKFQRLSFLSLYVGRGEGEDREEPIAIRVVGLVGRT